MTITRKQALPPPPPPPLPDTIVLELSLGEASDLLAMAYWLTMDTAVADAFYRQGLHSPFVQQIEGAIRTANRLRTDLPGVGVDYNK